MPRGDALTRVLEALRSRGIVLPRDGRIPCPAHGGDGRNLQITQGDVGVLVRCHSHGCDAVAIATAFGLSVADLFDDRRPRDDAGDRWTAGAWEYHDEHGAPLFRVKRVETFIAGKFAKSYPQERFDPTTGEWVGGRGAMSGVRRVLYRLPDVRAAIDRGDIICVTEGERAADALRNATGIVTTTTPEGAGKWAHREAAPPYAELLRGADVVLWPDNDDKGRTHMEEAAAALAGVANRVRIVRPDLPAKGDAFDWVASRADAGAFQQSLAAEFRQLVASAEDVTPTTLRSFRASRASSVIETHEKPLRVPCWPRPLGDAALHGVAGTLVRTIAPHTEADEAAILSQFLAAFGNAIGRAPFYAVEADEHHLNLYVLIVGNTASGRKGTSWGNETGRSGTMRGKSSATGKTRMSSETPLN